MAREAALAAARDRPQRAPSDGGSRDSAPAGQSDDGRHLLGDGRRARPRLGGRTRRIVPPPRRSRRRRPRDQGAVPGARRGIPRGRSGPLQRPVAAQEHGRRRASRGQSPVPVRGRLRRTGRRHLPAHRPQLVRGAARHRGHRRQLGTPARRRPDVRRRGARGAAADRDGPARRAQGRGDRVFAEARPTRKTPWPDWRWATPSG